MATTTIKKFETVIGLEVHLQLKTKTKIFCGCANIFGQNPNTQTCPVCLGLPGTLPVLNRNALTYAVKTGIALNCRINPEIRFDRKNYYYPDLPKGYQISQHALPIAVDGFVMITAQEGPKRINIKRAHLEEDAGKLIHDAAGNCSLVDYNRTGTPLLEIVTQPDLRSPEEAYEYLTTLKLILQYLNISDCDMEKGSLRCDANISVREKGATELGIKVELKNMNSFKAVKLGLEFEVNRHRQMVLSGERIVQETRLWNEAKGLTIAMRSKEEAHDYRYFPDPDLVPFTLEVKAIEEIKQTLPELPHHKQERLIEQYKISVYDAQIIIQDPPLADFFEHVTQFSTETKKICNWIIGPLLQEINNRKISINEIPIAPEELADIIKKVESGQLSNLSAKDVLKFKFETGHSIAEIIREKGLTQVSDDGVLEKIADEVISENTKIVDQIKQGKESALGFLVGQAMKKSQGKANPKKIGDIIKRRIV